MVENVMHSLVSNLEFVLRGIYIPYTYNFSRDMNFMEDSTREILVYILEYSGTCVLWTPWDQPKVSRLSTRPDFPGSTVLALTI